MLKNWKKIIWMNEISVIMKQWWKDTKMWWTVQKRYNKMCIHIQWKKLLKFMFWESFSYDHKSFYHIWKKETVKEKKKVQKEINKINVKNEFAAKLTWKLETKLRKLNLCRKTEERSSQWKYDVQHEVWKWKKNFKDIDVWCYQNLILKKKLLFFAVKCMQKHSDTLVQENKTFFHVFKHQIPVFKDFEMFWLLWSDNSLNLNVIESCWSWMKRWTTRNEALNHWLLMKKIWKNA